MADPFFPLVPDPSWSDRIRPNRYKNPDMPTPIGRPEIIDNLDSTVIKYNSFSGSDTNIYFLMDFQDALDISPEEKAKHKYKPISEIQTLSISSARSVHPVRRLGESHVTEYTRGARTIAGSMVFALGEKDIFSDIAVRSKRERITDAPFFSDEMPSFAILITCINEYGHVAHAALTDVTLTNFGTTHSESNMYLESTYTYVARYYHPLIPDPSILDNLDLKELGNGLSTVFNLSGENQKDWAGWHLEKNSLEAGVARILFGREHLFSSDEMFAVTKWMKEHQ